MTSKVLDLATMAHALNELCDDAFLGDCEWNGITDEQQEFLSWYAAHRHEIGKLTDLEALASTDYAELNQFLASHGFSPMFEPFAGVGVASILDMLMEWIVEGHKITMRRPLPSIQPPATDKDIYGRPIYSESVASWEDYPAFRLGSDAADLYNAPGFQHPVARLHTKTDHSLWLMKAGEPVSGVALNRLAQQVLAGELTPSREWTVGVTVPMLEMDIRADISWMIGMNTVSTTGEKYLIEQAFQQFKLRANDQGARVKVATGFGFAVSACGPLPKPYVFDEPFVGFFTQPGHDTLPMAAFWADTDVWQEPRGTLEEL